MKVYFVSAIFIALLVDSAVASDEQGRYYSGGGTGGVECPSYVSVMEKARLHGVGTVQYATDVQGFTMFVLGFQTGYNVGTPDTYDIFPNYSADQILAWIENYCRANPLKRFSTGIVSLAVELHANRTKAGTR